MPDTDPHDRRTDQWTLLAYIASRFKTMPATYCVLSGGLPFLILWLATASGGGPPSGTGFGVAIGLAPAMLALIGFHNLWHALLGQFLSVDAAPLLRISGDGRRLYRGLSGTVWVWTLAAWACSIPGLAFAATIAGEAGSIPAAATSGLGLLILFQAITMPVRVIGLTNRFWGGVLTVGLFGAFVVLVPVTLYALPVVLGQLLSPSLSAGAILTAGAAGAFVTASLFSERWIGAATGDEVGYRTKEIAARMKKDRAAIKKKTKTSRKSRRMRTEWPGVELAARRILLESNGLYAIVLLPAASVLIAVMTTGGRRWSPARIEEAVLGGMTFAAAVILISAIGAIAFGPMRMIAAEKEDQTFGLLALALGLKRAVLSLAVGTIVGVVVLAIPAAVWAAWLWVESGAVPPPVVGLGIAAGFGLLVCAGTYGLWAAVRADNMRQATGFLLAAVLLLPMLFAGPLLLKRQLDHELMPEGS